MRLFLRIALLSLFVVPVAAGRVNLGAVLEGEDAWWWSSQKDKPNGHVFLAVLLRTGKHGESPARVKSIKNTWARDLEPGSLIELQGDEACKKRWGDNHWEGLTCLEAKAHLQLMNRTNFDWLLVVDDDVYVFADRLRDTLRNVDKGRSEVYGAPGCGKCGGDKGFMGFCGGGGYILSRQSLLQMAGAKESPVPSEAGEAFLQHMMTPPNQNWCDVRFGCVAQEKGLKAMYVKGLYGNAITDKSGKKFDAKREERVVELRSQEPPLVFHLVRDDVHMEHVHKESILEKEKAGGKSTAYPSLKAWSPYSI